LPCTHRARSTDLAQAFDLHFAARFALGVYAEAARRNGKITESIAILTAAAGKLGVAVTPDGGAAGPLKILPARFPGAPFAPAGPNVPKRCTPISRRIFADENGDTRTEDQIIVFDDEGDET
jgi:hypothetical protein